MPAKRLLGVPPRSDVDANADQPGRRLTANAERNQAVADVGGEDSSVLVTHVELSVDRCAHLRVPKALQLGAFVLELDQFLGSLPDRLGRVVAEQMLRATAPVSNPALPVGQCDGGIDLVKQLRLQRDLLLRAYQTRYVTRDA